MDEPLTTTEYGDGAPETRVTPNAKWLEWLALATMASVVYFFLVVATLPLFLSGYNPAEQAISELAIGPHGYLMTAAFFALGVGSLALTLGLYLGVAPSARSKTGLILLGLWGIGVFCAGIFPIEGATVQTHLLVSLTSFVCFIVAATLLSRRLKKDRRWQSFHRIASLIALVSVAAFAYLLVQNAASLPGFGVGQRIFVGTVLLWLFVVANHLRGLAAGPASMMKETPNRESRAKR